METLIPWEKSLSETIPPVTQLIDLVASKGVHVGKRNQLDSGRGKGVEAWKLATASGQRQRKRLDTVPEKISAGEQVTRIEIVVHFRNKAGQAIEGGGND